MKAPFKKILVIAALLIVNAGIAHAANVDQMLEKCRSQAAKKLKVPGNEVQVKYEGQRTDKTHAVNGSTLVGGQNQFFQCSFEPKGRRIAKFVVNSPLPAAKSNTAADEDKVADASRRARAGNFDAKGRIPCAQFKGQPMGQCDFGVARAGGGSATVAVTHPDGRTRIIFFVKGKAISADTSQAGGYSEFRATKESDLFLIRVGDERYEITEAVVFGG